jgi:hypothetical protein
MAKMIVRSNRVGENSVYATNGSFHGDLPMPIVRELEHNGFRLYQLKATPLPQLVLVCHGGHGNSKTVAARDLSFYTTEDTGALIGADITVDFLSGAGMGSYPSGRPESMTFGLQTEMIARNKSLYNYHLYGQDDAVAMRRKDGAIAGVNTPAMDVAYPIPGRRRKLSDFWEFLAWLEQRLAARNLYPMVHCHFCRLPVGQ